VLAVLAERSTSNEFHFRSLILSPNTLPGSCLMSHERPTRRYFKKSKKEKEKNVISSVINQNVFTTGQSF
jgi:hypothetical protein